MLDRLETRPGARKTVKRLGRGTGSGLHKTSGRGVKGQGKRSDGAPTRLGFEGGQMPLIRRMPKHGFTNRDRQENEIVNLASLAAFSDGETVDVLALKTKGLIRGSGAPVKILGNGEPPKKLTVKVNRISKSAQTKLEANGGTVEIVN